MGRFTATMPGDPQAEALLAWRFHHGLTGIGTRNESTLYVGLSGTTQTPLRARRPGLSTASRVFTLPQRADTYREVTMFGRARAISIMATGAAATATIKVTRC